MINQNIIESAFISQNYVFHENGHYMMNHGQYMMRHGHYMMNVYSQ